MVLQEKQEQRTRDAVKKSWNENDIFGMLQVGFSNFMMILREKPRVFQKFLHDTGKFFDAFILDCMKKEDLKFIGGTMTIAFGEKEILHLAAKFYFQNAKKEWTLKTREGAIEQDRFSDWKTAPELIELRSKRQLSFPIDPPEEG